MKHWVVGLTASLYRLIYLWVFLCIIEITSAVVVSVQFISRIAFTDTITSTIRIQALIILTAAHSIGT